MGWTDSLGLVDIKLLHGEWISNEVLLYSTENHIQSLGIDHDGRRKGMHIWMTGSPCYTAEIGATL